MERWIWHRQLVFGCIPFHEKINHGGTRQLAVDLLPDAEILVFLTQDVELVEANAVSKLLTSFTDPNVAAAFGRQVPRPGATPIEAHSRYFNYPAQSSTRTLASRRQLGNNPSLSPIHLQRIAGALSWLSEDFRAMSSSGKIQ